MSRIQTFGEGGQIKELPYENLIEIVDVDDVTFERTVYYPPFEDVPPIAGQHEQKEKKASTHEKPMPLPPERRQEPSGHEGQKRPEHGQERSDHGSKGKH